ARTRTGWPRPPRHTLFPTRRPPDLLRSRVRRSRPDAGRGEPAGEALPAEHAPQVGPEQHEPGRHPAHEREQAEHQHPTFPPEAEDRKSTRLNSSHVKISYAVFCLKE